jgi:AraC-like DNA-binding protein
MLGVPYFLSLFLRYHTTFRTRSKASAHHLYSLVTDLVDLTQGESGRLTINCELVDIKEAFQPLFSMAQQMIERKGLSWHIQVDDQLPMLWGDKVRLRQIILNLLSNAVKFTDEGEIRLTVRSSEGVLSIEVSDTGSGIPAKDQEAVFAEFYQLQRASHQGLGLGLTICRRLVEMHGGIITLESSGIYGKGTTFRVLLPTIDIRVSSAARNLASIGASSYDIDTTRSRAAVDEPSQQSELQLHEAEKIVLIIDDDLLALRTHERLIMSQLSNTQVATAINGEQALDAIARKLPDLIVIDLVMPELDGFALIDLFRNNPITRAIPIIVLTGKSLTENDMKQLSKGVFAVLNKDIFSADEIVRHIENALSHYQQLGNQTQLLVRKVLAYLHQNYKEPVTRKDMAAYVGISEDYLTTCFQREFGMSPINYLNRYRINRAKVLMASNEYSLTEIALEVGFSSSSYFTRVFRRETGMPPRAYKAGWWLQGRS